MTTEPQYIEELMEQVEEAQEPGDLLRDQVLHQETEEVPLKVEIASIDSAGYVYIYNTQTGDRSVTNRNMLQDQLKKTFEDGSRVFTTIKPDIEPPVGTYKCLLHPSQPERAHYDSLGLAVCYKANLTSEYQVQRHMGRHRMEWATISEERERAEREEERAFQRRLMELMAQNANPATNRPTSRSTRPVCGECGKSFKSAGGLTLHTRQKH